MKAYTWEEYERIYKTMFKVRPSIYGVTALGSYRNMMDNIKINYNSDVKMMQELNELVTPYIDSIKADPNKALMPINK